MDPPLREHDTRNQFGAEVRRREVHHGVAEDGLLTGPGTRYSLRALALLELFFSEFSICFRMFLPRFWELLFGEYRLGASGDCGT